MKEIMEILNNLDWSPLFISIKTGIVATIISFFLGIYAARKVIKAKPWVKAVADGILTLPMVLPPTVAGFFLLLCNLLLPLPDRLAEVVDFKEENIGDFAKLAVAFPVLYDFARHCELGKGEHFALTLRLVAGKLFGFGVVGDGCDFARL